MKVYVVRCFVEGCEECGNEYHVLGVFSTRKRAEEVRNEHENSETHHHSYYVGIDDMELDSVKVGVVV